MQSHLGSVMKCLRKWMKQGIIPYYNPRYRIACHLHSLSQIISMFSSGPQPFFPSTLGNSQTHLLTSMTGRACYILPLCQRRRPCRMPVTPTLETSPCEDGCSSTEGASMPLCCRRGRSALTAELMALVSACSCLSAPRQDG